MSIPTIGNIGDAPVLPFAPQAGAVKEDAAALPSALKTQPPSQHSPQDVEKALQAIKDKIAPLANNDLQFSVDRDSGDTVVRIIDGKTGDLVRQIPSEEALAIAKDLDRLQGLLLQQKA